MTTDGCAKGFGGMLEQEFVVTMEDGTVHKNWHPIAFCLKRTSRSEERYKPFLLEFAVLKFALDEFTDLTFGSPIMIVTDCRALRDLLVSDQLNSTHARWQHFILSHQIVDVGYRLENPVADGISRGFGEEWTDRDGSSWSVEADWHARAGLTNSLWMVEGRQNNEETEELRTRFEGDDFFEPIVEALLGKPRGNLIKETRHAMRRAWEFMIEGRRLWKVGDKMSMRTSRVECIPSRKGFDTTLKVHMDIGHWSVDHVKLHVRDKFFWPHIDTDARLACLVCGQCKSFGVRRQNALLQPIIRGWPFEFLATDYLKLPLGKGKMSNVLFFMDAASGFVWGQKQVAAGTGKSTEKLLVHIAQGFAKLRVWQTDGGAHFKGPELKEACERLGIVRIVTPAYAVWVNGLVEGVNKLFLSCLKKKCAPDIDDSEYEDVDPESIPRNWPDFFEEAVVNVNDRIILGTRFTPREILFGLCFAPIHIDPEIPPHQPEDSELTDRMDLAEIMRMESLARHITDTERHQSHANDSVTPIKFKVGDLVQVYDLTLDMIDKAERKIAPRWSGPRIVVLKGINSYKLA